METAKKLKYDDIAEYILAFANESGEVITNLKLQKMVYYVQAWHLANFKKPLFEGEFQAWVHGPVIPAMYRKYRIGGSAPIVSNLKLADIKQKFSNNEFDFIGEVAKVYMQFGAYQLELMTHKEEPWIEARGGCEPDEKCETVISEETMKRYYGEKIKN